MRIEHEDVAEQQGRTVAANMLGRDVAHDTVPYFFSDLADWASLEYVGPASRWNEEIIRGSIQDGRFCCWYLLEDRVVAALSVGMPEVLDHARRLIRNHTAIGDAKRLLGDPDGDLASLG
jgi:3-phenylpropionate/trans-cinnamate dioxygenase ferredoxin reductase subunit